MPADEGDLRLAALIARNTGKSRAGALDELLGARAASPILFDVEELQKASDRASPDTQESQEPSEPTMGRRLRRAQRRKKRVAKVVARMIERAREAGDPTWKPEAFAGLDWKIGSEAWAALRDVTGRKARILAAGLPPAQGELLVADAKEIAKELELEEGYATMVWRERVASAWVSWRLSRPVRARKKSKRPALEQLEELMGKLALPPDATLQPPPKRENPWAGGRVVDGYARGAFALLIRNVVTGRPLSVSKLFYKNGSGQKGPLAYLATPAPEHGGRSRAVDGVLGLYTRWQPAASTSKYVGPVKRDASGEVLLDEDGNPMRFALSEHWYHRKMCGRRAASAADRGNAAAGSLIRELCPWLFEDDASAAELVSGLEELAASTTSTGEPEAAEVGLENAAATTESSAPRGPPS